MNKKIGPGRCWGRIAVVITARQSIAAIIFYLQAAHTIADLSIDVSEVPLTPTMTLGGFADILTTLGYGANANKILVDEDSASFAELGLNIDTGKYVMVIERTELEITNTFSPKNVRQFVMGGVRFNNVLVHLTYSEAKDELVHPEAGIPANLALPVVGSSNLLIGTTQALVKSQQLDREVISLGTRWDVTGGTALKFQLDDVDDKSGQQKVFSVALQTVF